MVAETPYFCKPMLILTPLDIVCFEVKPYRSKMGKTEMGLNCKLQGYSAYLWEGWNGTYA